MANKKKFKKFGLFVGVLVIIVGTYLWSTKVAPTHFELKEISYTNSKIPVGFDGFRIALISDLDLQSTENLDYLEKCINTINKAECDMVIFAGDLYEGKLFSQKRLTSILKSLNMENGKLAVLGENELKSNTDECIQLLEESGFEVMRNSAHYIYSGDDRIVFVGLENSGNVDALLNEEMLTSFVLSAVHQPDYYDNIQKSASELQLSGHSGGGFINIPFIGGLIKFDGCKNYTQSLLDPLGHSLVVTNGIGMGHEQTIRFNCNPNAIIITLQAPIN